jgi:hypothetical protein
MFGLTKKFNIIEEHRMVKKILLLLSCLGMLGMVTGCYVDPYYTAPYTYGSGVVYGDYAFTPYTYGPYIASYRPYAYRFYRDYPDFYRRYPPQERPAPAVVVFAAPGCQRPRHIPAA